MLLLLSLKGLLLVLANQDVEVHAALTSWDIPRTSMVELPVQTDVSISIAQI